MTATGNESEVLMGVPRRGLRERHLDLLLAEEFAVNWDFARWVAENALSTLPDGRREPLTLPAGAPSTISSTVSYWDPTGYPAAAGETDVLVRLDWDGGASVGLFVEDKLDALFQPWQAERYAARASAAHVPTATVLIAPRDFIRRHGSSALFGKAVAIEDIAAWLRVTAENADPPLAARLRWRSVALGVVASARPTTVDDPRAVRFTALFAEAVEVPGCVVDRMSCHTANQGWIWFREPSALGYKATHGVVDLYVKDLGVDLGFDAVGARLEGHLPSGFAVGQDSVPNTVLRSRMPRSVNPVDALTADGEIDDRETFYFAVRACQEAVQWLAAGGAVLLQSP